MPTTSELACSTATKTLARPSRMVIVCVMSVPHISLTLSVMIVPSCGLVSVRSVVRFGEQFSQKVNKHGDFAGLGWVDGSYLLFVEPRLIGNLDVVSVRVADVCREVVGTPFGPNARFLD